MLTILTQNDKTIQDNFVIINDVTWFLDNYLAEVNHDDSKEIILHRSYDEAILAIVKAGDNSNTSDAIDTSDAINNNDDNDTRSVSNSSVYYSFR